MPTTLSRRRALEVVAGLGVSLSLPPARACEAFTSTLRVLHPWTRATVPDARSAFVALTIDQVHTSDRLVGLSTPVAEGAELAGPEGTRALDLALPAGSEWVLAPPGLHIRLTGLQHGLEVARSYPLTLRFAVGGELLTSLSVDYARFG